MTSAPGRLKYPDDVRPKVDVGVRDCAERVAWAPDVTARASVRIVTSTSARGNDTVTTRP